ncbi:MAG: DUF934 domain-containing protein [Motiliproteus sp.]
MPLLIDQKTVSDDRWIRITDIEQLDHQAAEADLLVDWGLYIGHCDALVARSGRLGVAIPNDLDAAELASIAAQFALIAVDFPSFADGRAFSQARKLRALGFSGQIRAQGDVTWDRLRFMHRCGIDAMEIADERFTPEMTTAFSEIGVHNQGAYDDPNPSYRQH